MRSSFLSLYKFHDHCYPLFLFYGFLLWFPLLWCQAFSLHLSKFWSPMIYFYSAILSGSEDSKRHGGNQCVRNLHSLAQPWWVCFHKIFLIQQVKHMSGHSKVSCLRAGKHSPLLGFTFINNMTTLSCLTMNSYKRASICMFTVWYILSEPRYYMTNRIYIYIFLNIYILYMHILYIYIHYT